MPPFEAQNWERDATNDSVSLEGASPFCALAQHSLAGLDQKDEGKLKVPNGCPSHSRLWRWNPASYPIIVYIYVYIY